MKRWAGAFLLTVCFHTEPVPASRPRVSRWGTYYGKNYERFRKEATTLAQAMEGVPTDRPVVVFMEIVSTKPKAGKMTHPNGDVDNYAKGPLDIMTKAGKFWKDDRQVIGLTVFKRYAKPDETAHVQVEWFAVEED